MLKSPPNPGWIPFLKLWLGGLLVLMLGVITVIIGLGTVKQESSFGLDITLGALISIASNFGGWAFSRETPRDETPSRAEPATPSINGVPINKD